MVKNISCKFKMSSYNIFLASMASVKSPYPLWCQCNEAKSIVSTRCYPVNTIITSKDPTVQYTQTQLQKMALVEHSRDQGLTLKDKLHGQMSVGYRGQTYLLNIKGFFTGGFSTDEKNFQNV